MSDPFDPFDLFPYRAIIDAPKIEWPNKARVAVWVIPNIEHFHIDLFPNPPDIRNYSRRDYGNRVGIWRMMEVMSRHSVRGTVALNAEVVQHYPRIMEEAAKLDWEFMGHGLTNSTILTGMTLEQEHHTVFATKNAIESLGQRMRGWLGPGLTETWRTLSLLAEAGAEYVCDWVNDDLPYRMSNGLYSIPYTIEVNDMPLFNAPSISIQDFYQRMVDTFDVLYDEGARNPRVMAIALHPFLIGAPHRIRYLDRALTYMAQREGVWFATGSEIIESYRAQVPA
jgi:allantoinase